MNILYIYIINGDIRCEPNIGKLLFLYENNLLIISNSSLNIFAMLIKIVYMCYVNSHGKKKSTKQFNQTISAQNCIHHHQFSLKLFY